MKRIFLLTAALILANLPAHVQAIVTETPVIEWTRQLGTVSEDQGFGVSVDGGGNAYVTGYTRNSLDGNTNAGNQDMFLAKYDTVGNKRWTRQLGTSAPDYGADVSVDSSGNAYVTGRTFDGLDGNSHEGSFDIFLTKYNAAGAKQWTEQLGSHSWDDGHGVAVDGGGNAYVTGYTYGSLPGSTQTGPSDIVLAKYDDAGNRQWTKQLGAQGQHSSGYDVAVDGSGNAYVTGSTNGGLNGNANSGEEDMFLAKYNPGGARLWTKQLGSSNVDEGYGVSVDSSGNAYIAGITNGNFDGNTNAGNFDMFLAKYDTNGNKQWSRQLGTTDYDYGLDAAVDGGGNAYVVGRTAGDLDGNTNLGNQDIFVVKYDTAGNKLWTCQMGTRNNDYGHDVALDDSGNAYVTGYTNGDLDGNTNVGGADIFLVKISTIPEPSTLILLLTGALGVLACGWRRRR